MNKKGIISVAMVMAIFIGVLLLTFLGGGGLSKTIEISRFLKSIPAPIWVIFGIIILFKITGKKR